METEELVVDGVLTTNIGPDPDDLGRSLELLATLDMGMIFNPRNTEAIRIK